MVEMILAWLLAPALLVLTSYGLGLLLSLTIRKRLTFALAAPMGFLLIVILGSLFTMNASTVPYAAISIEILAVLGFFATAIWFRSYFLFDWPSGLAGICVYFLSGLPVIAYGHPSWAGWVQLDDTASWFAITNRLMTVGQTGINVINSTYERLIQLIFGTTTGSIAPDNFSYPLGSFLPFGIMSKLTGIERAWLFQPYLALAAGMSAMVLVVIARERISKKWISFVVGTISLLASTIFSYEMWGGIKEIVILIPLLLFAYFLLMSTNGRSKAERYSYAAVTLLGFYFVGGKTSLGLVMPIVLVALLAKVSIANRKIFLGILAAVVVVSGMGIYFLRAGNNALGRIFVPVINDPGNLARPLNLLQVMGIWPSQDFRLDPIYRPLTYSLIAIALAMVVVGIASSFKNGWWILPGLMLSCLSVIGYSYYFAGIWITGKAIAVASPVFVFAAGIGAYEAWKWLGNNPKFNFGLVRAQYVLLALSVMVASGVLVSDAMTYRNIWIAPYSQVNELRQIGTTFAGQGPTLMTDYSVFGSRYFLRNVGAESASELRVHPILMSDGTQVPKGFSADIGLFDSATINNYNLLVLRKSPVASRPPLNYELAWSGMHYEVWRKVANSPTIKSMLPIGNNFTPGAIPACQDVTNFLAKRAKGEKIFAVARNKTYLVSFSNGDLPSKWIPTSPLSGAVDRTGSGGFSRTFAVDETGFYDLSLAGSFPGKLSMLIDGDPIYSGHSVFEGNPTLTNTLTKVHLSAGQHVLTLIYTSPILIPGSDVSYRFGPIFLSTQFAGDAKAKQVSSSRIPQLCTENLDWIAITN